MAKGATDLEKLLKLAQQYGLKRLKVGSTEFEFGIAIHHSKTPSDLGAPLASLNEERPPSDDEMLYASTPYFDVLRAEREKASREAS